MSGGRDCGSVSTPQPAAAAGAFPRRAKARVARESGTDRPSQRRPVRTRRESVESPSPTRRTRARHKCRESVVKPTDESPSRNPSQIRLVRPSQDRQIRTRRRPPQPDDGDVGRGEGDGGIVGGDGGGGAAGAEEGQRAEVGGGGPATLGGGVDAVQRGEGGVVPCARGQCRFSLRATRSIFECGDNCGRADCGFANRAVRRWEGYERKCFDECRTMRSRMRHHTDRGGFDRCSSF